MLHLSEDSHGAQSWSPGWTTVTRNLLVNSYGAGHGIDHDDGSMFWQDVGNVVAFSHACKGNFGDSRGLSPFLADFRRLSLVFAHVRRCLQVPIATARRIWSSLQS